MGKWNSRKVGIGVGTENGNYVGEMLLFVE